MTKLLPVRNTNSIFSAHNQTIKVMTNKLTAFHLAAIATLVSGFYFNSIGPEGDIQIINNLFLGLISISYVAATLLDRAKA